jgi:hypothetical protein
MSLRYGFLSAHASGRGHIQAAYSLCSPFCYMTFKKKRAMQQWRVLSSGILSSLSPLKTVFARSNTGIVGSKPTQGMDICLRLFRVYVGSGLATSWSPVQGVVPTVLGLRNWSETKRFTDALCSTVGSNRKYRESLLKVNPHFKGT